MTTFDELFGNAGSASGDYLKWTTEGESYVLKVTGKAAKTHHQIDFATKKPKYFVQSAEFGKNAKGENAWKVMKEGEFDSIKVDKANPIMEIEIPVEVLKHKNVKNEDDPEFEPFEMNWVLNKNQEDKLKEAMLDSQLTLAVGTLVSLKWLSMDGKARNYKIALKAAE